MNFCLLLSVLVFCTALNCINTSASSSPRIGVIGGGIGGTSSAFFLRELFGPGVPITVFEQDRIGGRVKLINVNGKYYEAGASVIHPLNAHMMEFINKLGLEANKPSSVPCGIYDGQHFVYEESKWRFVTFANFLYRYGFSFFELTSYISSMLSDFSRIYSIQKDGHAFTTVSGMLDAMNQRFKNMTQETLSNYLSSRISSQLLIEEIIQSVMMVNYGQTNNVSAFVGFVSLAGADSSLLSIDGGNKLVAEGLLKKSNATLVKGEVTEITSLPDGTYSLKYSDVFSGKTLEKHYDIIIIARPLHQKDNLKFINFDKDFEQYHTEFHRTVATFVRGTLNPLAFNAEKLPDEILTFKPSLLFNSISKVSTCDGEKDTGVYKIFSQQPISKENLDIMFSNIEEVDAEDWLAYPTYTAPEKLMPFFLYPGLYYVNAIESCASAMEMSAVGGKNVALLAHNLWNHNVDKVDHFKRIYREEL